MPINVTLKYQVKKKITTVDLDNQNTEQRTNLSFLFASGVCIFITWSVFSVCFMISFVCLFYRLSKNKLNHVRDLSYTWRNKYRHQAERDSLTWNTKIKRCSIKIYIFKNPLVSHHLPIIGSWAQAQIRWLLSMHQSWIIFKIHLSSLSHLNSTVSELNRESLHSVDSLLTKRVTYSSLFQESRAKESRMIDLGSQMFQKNLS